MLKKFMLFLCLLLAGWGSAFSNGNLQNGDIETNEKVLKAIDDVKNKRDNYALRALELSLYYQGFDPDKNLYLLFDFYYGSDILIPYNSELYGTRKIRDAKKAFEYAKIAYELKLGKPISELNLCEKDIMLVDSIFVSNLATLYVLGIGVEKDLSKKKFLMLADKMFNWKNYYAGKFIPRDKKYAISLLEKGITYYERRSLYEKSMDSALASLFLYLIYNGELDPEDKDLEKAKYWKDISNKRMSKYRAGIIKEWEAENEKLKKAANTESEEGRQAYRVLAFNHLKKRECVWKSLYNRSVYISNPNYNPELAKKYLKCGGFNEVQIAAMLVATLSFKSTGDLNEAKRLQQQEVPSSPAFIDEFNKLMMKRMPFIEKRNKEYCTPYYKHDKLIEKEELFSN